MRARGARRAAALARDAQLPARPPARRAQIKLPDPRVNAMRRAVASMVPTARQIGDRPEELDRPCCDGCALA